MVLISASSLCYYLILFQLKSFSGEMIPNTLSSQLAEISANILSMFLYQQLNPKTSFATMFSLSLFGSILLFVYRTPENVQPSQFYIVYVFAAKFGISSTFNTCFICFVQLIPTLYASSAFGFCNILARTLTILSPYLAEQNHPIPILSLIIMTTVGVAVSFGLVTKLPRFI